MMKDEPCIVLIKKLETNIEKRMNNAMKEIDMTITQVRALSILLEFPDKQAALKLLEKKLMLAQSVTAGIVKRLEQRGYAESNGDLEDRRIKVVKITPLGEQQYQRAQKITTMIQDDFLSGLTDEERQTFYALLKKLKRSIEQ